MPAVLNLSTLSKPMRCSVWRPRLSKGVVFPGGQNNNNKFFVDTILVQEAERDQVCGNFVNPNQIMDGDAAQAVAAPASRRRLRQKQRPPVQYAQAPVPVVAPAPAVPAVAVPTEDEIAQLFIDSPQGTQLKAVWTRMDASAKRNQQQKLCMRRLRHWRVACTARRARVDGREWDVSGNVNDPNEFALFNRRWTFGTSRDESLSEVERATCLALYVQILEEGRNGVAQSQLEISGGFPVLLTYNGDWGVLDISSIAGFGPSSSIDDVAMSVAELPAVRVMEDANSALCERLMSDRAVDAWAWSLELCPKSVRDAVQQNTQSIRFHVHIYLKPTGLTLVKPALDLNGSTPHIAKTILSRMGVGRSRSGNSVWAACFYVSVKKIGSISRRASVEMFVDYLVLEGWVWNLIQMRKLSYDEGKALFMEIGRNCAVHLVSLETAKRQRQTQSAEAAQRQDKLRLRSQQFPFKRIAEVDRWLQLFDSFSARYPFLILDGSSCLGKTRFVHSLVPENACYYCDCSNDQLPDLRRFDRDQHKLLLLDEMGPKTAITLKKLLQSGCDMVSLGISPTQQFTYSVYVRATKIVLTSNNWERDLKTLEPNDQEWLSTNSHYVNVLEPLWHVPESAHAPTATPSRQSDVAPAPATPRLNVAPSPIDLASWLPLIEAPGTDGEDELSSAAE